MNRDEARKEDGKPFKVMSVVVSQEYLAPGYALVRLENQEPTDTAFLVVFKLIPTSPTEPLFVGRWDYQKDIVDIDGQGNGVEPGEVGRFLSGKDPLYAGHHGIVADAQNRSMRYEVVFRGKEIFRGTVTVGVLKKLGLIDSIDPS